jgi:hypothetical protein
MIQLVQLVPFDDGDKQLRIFGICGVARFFEAMRPAFIIFTVQLEQKRVAWISHQKLGVIDIAQVNGIVGAKAFILFVIVFDDGSSRPGFFTFYSEMVVALHRQPRVSVSGFQKAL